MNRHTILCALALVVAATAARPADAQQFRIEPARRAWLGLSYDVTIQRRNQDVTQTVVVTDVVAASPAQRAGLQVGDTLIAVNDIPISDQLLGSLGVSLNPGDRVRLRVRRGGAERTLDVEAAAPPADYLEIAPGRGIVRFDTDSLRGRVGLLMDSLRMNLDSLRLPRFYIERLPGGIVFGSDSTIALRAFPFDSFTIQMDSLAARFHLFSDSAGFRGGRFQMYPDSFFMRGDSLRSFMFAPGQVRLRSWNVDSADARAWGFAYDTAGLRSLEALPFQGIVMRGRRSIAGAELADLEPGLGEYFGADAGVLVVRVPDGTPAADAGLRAGDVILGADGRDIADIGELRRVLARAPAATIRLEVLRKRQRLELRFERE